MASTNQQLASLVANLTANSAGNITGANIANRVGNLYTFISNNGTSVQSVGIQSSTAAGFIANYTLTLPIDDGTNGQVLSTDGSGVLSWSTISSSSITNGNSNVVVAGNANVTMAVTSTNAFTLATNLVSIGANAGNANPGANSVYIGRQAALDGGSFANTVVINGGNTTLNPAIANATYLAPVRFDQTSANVANNKIITYDTNTKELRYGSPVFGYALENITISGTAPTGTVNLDVLSNAIYLATANATSNVTLNIRGNGTTTLNSMLAVGQSIGVSFVMTNGTGNFFYANVLQIDGTTVTAKSSANAFPALAATTLIHTYTIVKTAATPTYSAFTSITNYS